MFLRSLRTRDSGNICVIHLCRRWCIGPLHLEHARPDAGNLAFEFDSTLLAHANPLADAEFQDTRAYGFRSGVSRLRGHCCWDEDGKDGDDRNPTRWLLAQEIRLFHAHRC